MNNYVNEFLLEKSKKVSLFSYKPITLAVLAILFQLSASQMSFAADDSVIADLKSQIEQLKKELAASQQKNNPQTDLAASNTNVLASSPDQQVKKDEEEAKKIDGVVVTGKRQRKQKVLLDNLKDVPKSVSIVSGEELDRLGANNITEVLRRVGNVNFNYGNPRTGSLTLRGITTGSSDQIDPTIGTVLDGVSLGYTPLVNGYVFTDIDTVDVTRGPQGTQGGKPSNIGRITFNTKAPTFTPEANFALTYGEWNRLITSAVVGGPVIDDLLAWRGTFQREQGDGAYGNTFPDLKGRASYQNVDRTFGRVQFLLTPTDDFTAKLSLENQPKGSEFVNGLTVKHAEPTVFSDGVARPVASVDTTYKKYLRPWFNNDPTLWNTARDYYNNPVDVDNNGAIITGSKGATLNLNWHVAGHDLQSITGYRSHWFSAANDEGTPFDITKSGGYITDYSQISQEFRISSEKGKFVDYLAGLYFLSTDNDSISRTRYGNDAGAFQASDALYNSLATTGSGQTILKDSLNFAYKGTQTYVKNKSAALFAQADWHLSDPLTLNTGVRFSHEDRETSQGVLLLDPGVGSDFTTAFGNSSSTKAIAKGGAAAADRLAARYFGSTWANLSTAQQNQLLSGAQVRNGTLTPASLYPVTDAPAWEGNIKSWNASLTNKFNDTVSAYGTLQYGEKGGMSQFAVNGTTSTVDKEQTNGYELGLRLNLLNNTLTINSDIFLNDIKNFQTTVNIPDPIGTAAFLASNPSVSLADAQQFQSVVGNLPGVRVKGLEIDAAYTGLQNLTLSLSAAYNDAYYSKDTYLAKPNEVDSTGKVFQKYYNAKGSVLNSAPKFTANLAADYKVQVFGDKVFHTSADYKFTSSYATSPSSYDVYDAYGLLDLGVGIGRKDGLFDVSVVVKNLLNTSYHTDGWNSYTPNIPRWFGVTFKSKL
ncbi:TonB-dependent receptor domain-containing protein [Aquirhabdus parva]|uniref:TonB-dependent receptor n=1 Tax=Aquirhabdus parva TaxID=2283318 RepID=A0A345P4X3_9GAMM|nr:TonB-dependent receptor [Aquirhabdus parva]AXI02332.1 hypothetical protein HYN46_05480 [Aquirhabdus parva]